MDFPLRDGGDTVMMVIVQGSTAGISGQERTWWDIIQFVMSFNVLMVVCREFCLYRQLLLSSLQRVSFKFAQNFENYFKS